MEESTQPSSTSALPIMYGKTIHKRNHNLYGLLIKTMTYGEVVRNRIYEAHGSGILLSPLLNITLVIEEQLQNILTSFPYRTPHFLVILEYTTYCNSTPFQK